mgnify:CR=1 FL=1
MPARLKMKYLIVGRPLPMKFGERVSTLNYKDSHAALSAACAIAVSSYWLSAPYFLRTVPEPSHWRTDREREFVESSGQRGSGTEPVNVHSG